MERERETERERERGVHYSRPVIFPTLGKKKMTAELRIIVSQ